MFALCMKQFFLPGTVKLTKAVKIKKALEGPGSLLGGSVGGLNTLTRFVPAWTRGDKSDKC